MRPRVAKGRFPCPAAPVTVVRGLALAGALLALGGCGLFADREREAAEPAPTVVADGREVDQGAARRLLARAVPRSLNEETIMRLERSIEALSGDYLYHGNAVELLVDGPETYDSMLAAIGEATDHIHLETYIFRDDAVGLRFAEALMEKARNGVEVKVIYDAFGSRKSHEGFFSRLSRSDIELLEYHDYDLLEGENPFDIGQRTHRKILVVDGRVAFAGGINFTHQYSSSSRSKRRPVRDPLEDGWRDTHVRIEGPAVHAVQRTFLSHWREENDAEAIDEDDVSLFPQTGEPGSHLVRVLAATGGEEEGSIIRKAYLLAIGNAQRNVWITQAYFAPDDEFLDTLEAAAERGVDVRVLTPGISDSNAVVDTSRALYDGLLAAGVRIYETDDAVLHAKTAVIDGVWSTVGSSNLDFLSLYYNDEINAVIVGGDFGAAMEELFLDDLDRAGEILLAAWRQRPLWRKLKENMALRLRRWL